ncbi:unnamed protein product [Timema podura]|uniref:Uncharacterized protein n=1 Tax=Timema podura TaxID=61482 RepID=A0ABN7NSK8_TIMPD|nr:unnamed protein product [Timema podura]
MTIMRWAFIALACLVFPQVWARTTDDNNLKTQKYQWKTGSWGTCYVAGGCGEGRRERQVRCSDPEGRTVLELMCDPITAPLKIKLCFTACRHHRDKLQWQVGAWGPCLPVSPAGLAAETTDIKERENLGVTQRNVTCVLVSHDAVKVRLNTDIQDGDEDHLAADAALRHNGMIGSPHHAEPGVKPTFIRSLPTQCHVCCVLVTVG